MQVGIANLQWRGKTFPAFPVYAQPVILRNWQEAHCNRYKMVTSSHSVPVNSGFFHCFHCYCAAHDVMMCANYTIRYGPTIMICLHITPLHYHNCAELSRGIRYVNWLPGIFHMMCLRCRLCSPLYVLRCIWFLVFSRCMDLLMIEKYFYVFDNRHHQIGRKKNYHG